MIGYKDILFIWIEGEDFIFSNLNDKDLYVYVIDDTME